LRKQDEAAFEYMYDQYSPALYGAILRLVPDPLQAEEILHDTFLKIWSKIQTYDPSKGRFFTWIVNIARHLAVDKLRSGEARKQKATAEIDTFRETLKKYRTEQDIDSIGIRDLLKLLPCEQAFVLDHIYFKGYSQSDIAREFNIPLGTIKTRSCLGMKKLHSILKHK
jgi:RNA polymerase sigma factor (sigma-70 family)